MRADDDLASTGVQQVPKREQRGLDARVVCDHAVLEGDVEVGSDENALARDVRSTDGARRVLHGAASDQVDEAAAVAPLVVVPAEHFDGAPLHHRELAVEDAGVRVAVDVRRDDGILRVVQEVLERAAVRGGAEGVVDLVDVCLAAERDHEVRERARRYGRTYGDAVHLALQVGEDEPDRLRGAGRCRDQVDRGRTRPAEVLVGEVEDHLVVRVRVNGRHEAALDLAELVEHLGERRDAVRRAGRVRDDVVRLGVVRVVVDAEDDCEVRVGRGGGDDDFLRPGVEVLLRTFAIGEEPGRLDDDVHAEITPRESSGVALREDLDLLARCLEDTVRELHLARERPEVRVVAQQVRHRLRIAEVVQRDDLEVRLALVLCAEEVPPDPAEPVDSDANAHLSLRPLACSRGRV